MDGAVKREDGVLCGQISLYLDSGGKEYFGSKIIGQ